MTKILIIGGTGNISTEITRQLITRGADLTLFKRKPEVPQWMKGARVVTGDRTNFAEFRDKVSALGDFDCVIDMVGYEPAEAQSFAEVFRGRTSQLIFCSTVDVYSKTPKSYPVTEANGEIGASPSFSYAVKKVQCEQILWKAHSDGDFALTVFRPAFTYNDTWSPGLHTFGGQTYHLDRVRKGKPFILHGDGNAILVATHCSDAATAFVNAVGNKAAFGEAFNLTGDELMTYNHAWRTIAGILKAPDPEFVYIPSDILGKLAPEESKPALENFRYNNIFDNSKAKAVLSFRYTVSFETGARRCIENLMRHNAIEDCDRYPFYDRLLDTWRQHPSILAPEVAAQT